MRGTGCGNTQYMGEGWNAKLGVRLCAHLDFGAVSMQMVIAGPAGSWCRSQGRCHSLQKLNGVKKPRVEEDCGRRDKVFLEILKDRPDVPLWEGQIPTEDSTMGLIRHGLRVSPCPEGFGRKKDGI